MAEKDKFTFEISLSVLNHLGRNLYRSFITVLGEAISNSWDADATNVWIDIDRENDSFFIKDDGDGMTSDDFQNKFLKIGYSKRKDGEVKSKKGRSYIGRKGIGKLAMLSCAERIIIISKTEESEYVGGIIDNRGLDEAIKEDLKPGEYVLADIDLEIFGNLVDNHKKGTIIKFEKIKEGIRNKVDYLKKVLALNFKFSLIDNSFNIFVNKNPISYEDLDALACKSQFLWNINRLSDPFVENLLKKENLKENGLIEKEKNNYIIDKNIKGFIASVVKPLDLKILTTDERVAIDLFVNGRIREKDILKHIPTSRIVENYLYGQIHFDGLDDEIDRFATNREGFISDDPKFKYLLDELKRVISIILEEWDEWRIKHRSDGDTENLRIKKRDRKSKELYNIVTEDFILPKSSDEKDKVDSWVNELSNDATFNFGSYAECFASENLIRKYIKDRNIVYPLEITEEITNKKNRESDNKRDGNININIRKNNDDLSYLDMKNLSKIADVRGRQNTINNDAKEYKPVRDALMHTALLTDEAKTKLTSIYNNIKSRIRNLLAGLN